MIHDICQGETEIGHEAFRKFMEFCFDVCNEKARDILIIVSENGRHAAVKLVIDGVYLKSVTGYPSAKNQKYTLPIYAFLKLRMI